MEEKNVNSGVEVAESLNERLGGVVKLWLCCHVAEDVAMRLDVLSDFTNGETHEMLHDVADMIRGFVKEVEAE